MRSIWERDTKEEDIRQLNEAVAPFIFGLVVTIVVFFLGFYVGKIKQQDIYQHEINMSRSNIEYTDINGGRFTILNEFVQNSGNDESIHYYIAYDNKTKVMYTVGKAEGSSPSFTVMVNNLGVPMLYEEEEGEN